VSEEEVKEIELICCRVIQEEWDKRANRINSDISSNYGFLNRFMNNWSNSKVILVSGCSLIMLRLLMHYVVK
jgi:hypothetical protein